MGVVDGAAGADVMLLPATLVVDIGVGEYAGGGSLDGVVNAFMPGRSGLLVAGAAPVGLGELRVDVFFAASEEDCESLRESLFLRLPMRPLRLVALMLLERCGRGILCVKVYVRVESRTMDIMKRDKRQTSGATEANATRCQGTR